MEPSSASPGLARAALVLVTKVPLPGSSKTRLVPALGQDGAEAAATAMLTDVLRMAKKEGMEGVDCIVHYVPAAEGPRLQALLRSVGVVNDWALAPNVQQSVKSTDLSDLLSGAFGELSTRYRSVTFIGSDTPQLSVEHVLQGMAVAEGGDAFVAPALDGGYVLLSLPSRLSDCAVDLFAGIRWSTEDTLRDQVACIEAVECKVIVGPSYVDIDSPKDARGLLDICHGIVAEGAEIPCPESFRVLGMYLEAAGV